jgi:hypothetical protein
MSLIENPCFSRGSSLPLPTSTSPHGRQGRMGPRSTPPRSRAARVRSHSPLRAPSAQAASSPQGSVVQLLRPGGQWHDRGLLAREGSEFTAERVDQLLQERGGAVNVAEVGSLFGLTRVWLAAHGFSVSNPDDYGQSLLMPLISVQASWT